MGREQRSIVMQPNQSRREERARRARDMKNRDIPEILRSSPRARHGIHRADLIVDPAPFVETSRDVDAGSVVPAIKIRVQCADTLSAAGQMSERPFAAKRPLRSRPSKPNVAVLNMASQLRPGGGFLDGANSQEEFICARTTLYPSLWDSFYRLPEISGIYSPDVLVFRDHLPEANELCKRDRFFIDVISAGMFKFSDARGEGCSCGVSYCDHHRDLATRKMKAVLRIAQMKGVERLVLGAWGCGAYGNPVAEIAKLWRKVIGGTPRQRRPNAERWDGIREIVFAIPDRTMVREFESAFQGILAADEPVSDAVADSDSDEVSSGEISELLSKIAETEMQIEQTQSSRLRAYLRDGLANLRRELTQGLAAKAMRDDDDDHHLTPESEEHEDDDGFVFAGSDVEDNGFYHFDENDIASDSSDSGTASESYEFRAPPSQRNIRRQDSDSRRRDKLCGTPYAAPPLMSSSRFDAETGWFSGSMDQLSAMLRGGMIPGVEVDDHGPDHGPDHGRDQDRDPCATGGKASPCSPSHALVRPDSYGGIDEFTLREYLARYQGSDVTED